MEWFDINNDKPKKYEEVIVASIDGTVKSAVYLDNGKFTTYLQITHWMHMPDAPVTLKKDNSTEHIIEPIKKKRGRPKKR